MKWLAIDVTLLGQWLATVALLLGAWLIYRGGGGAALHTLETANRVLERRVSELEAENRDQANELLQLRARTDHVTALEPVLREIRDHDFRITQQHEHLLTVLNLIAARLGPDNDHPAD